MKLRFLLILFSFFCLSNLIQAQFYYDSTKVEHSTNTKLNKICSHPCSYYNYSGINVPLFFDNMEDDSLFRTIPAADLQYLFLHTNPYLRAYASKYYFEKPCMDIDHGFKLIKSQLFDTVRISAGSSCEHGYEKICDIFYANFKYCFNKSKGFDKYLKELDSIVLNSNFDKGSQLLFNAVQRVKGNKKYYQKVRELAIENYHEGVISLAEFRNQNDVDLILNSKPIVTTTEIEELYPYSYKNYIVKAISKYPNTKFYPFLIGCYKAYIKGDRSILLFNLSDALVAMHEHNTISKIEDLISYYSDAEKVRCKSTVLNSISENYHPIFDSLLLSICQEENWINDTVVKYLKAAPELAFVSKNVVNKKLKGEGNSFQTYIENNLSVEPAINFLIKINKSFIDSIYQLANIPSNLRLNLISAYLKNGLDIDFNKALTHIINDYEIGTIDLVDIRYTVYDKNEKFDAQLLDVLKNSKKGNELINFMFLFENP